VLASDVYADGEFERHGAVLPQLKQFPIIWKRSPHASSNSHILEH
jgi:hypothetical protein